jgi:hypothetical protein
VSDGRNDGKAHFKAAAARNRAKVEKVIRSLMRVGNNQVPGLNAGMLLVAVRQRDSSIPSDTAHTRLVDEIVTANGWRYQPKPRS